MIRGDRVVLRPTTADDLAFLRTFFADGVSLLTPTLTTSAMSRFWPKVGFKPVRVVEGDGGRKPYWLMEWPAGQEAHRVPEVGP
jgi:hypothetical protein